MELRDLAVEVIDQILHPANSTSLRNMRATAALENTLGADGTRISEQRIAIKIELSPKAR